MPRIGLGLGLRAWIARVSSGTVPPDASGAIGDVAFVTSESRWYEKRWVANREGAGDSILFPINLFPSVGDFDFSVRVRRDNVQNGGLRLVSTDPNGSNAVGMAIGTGWTYHAILLRSSAGAVQYQTDSTTYDAKWHTLGARRSGGVLTTLVDGVVTGTTASTPVWTPTLTETGTRCLYTPDTASLSIKCCDLRLTGPGGSIIAPLNEGTGTTVTNQAGANGTLTDGSPTNFWYAAWVPMDVPSMDFRIPDNSQYIGAI